MSAETDSNTSRKMPIFVRLFDEGTEVSRPTQGLDLGNGLFQVLDTKDRDAQEETWEFPPGSVVRGGKRVDSNGEEYLLAIKA